MGWLRSAVALACLVIAGCGGGDSSGSCGGKFTACGGKVVGDWNVSTICFENPEAVLGNTLNEPACNNAVRDVRVSASGTYSFGADGTASTQVKETISMSILITSACVSALAMQTLTLTAQVCSSLQTSLQGQGSGQSGGGFSKVGCSFAQGGCLCDVSLMSMDISGGGAYMTSGNNLTTGSTAGVPYCVEGDTLRLSVTESGLSGTIVLERK